MMEILGEVDSLNLPDWWIGAGFVRSKVWDYLHGYKERTPMPDIDVIYFDSSESDPEKREEIYKRKLIQLHPNLKWQVKNQARMHLMHRRNQYKNSEEALSEWSETATCVGVRIEKNKLKFIAPHGIQDLVDLKIRKIPGYKQKYNHDINLFDKRIKDKGWLEKWPKLTVAE